MAISCGMKGVNFQQLLITTVFSFAFSLGKAHADSEIKIQGKSTATGVWSEIEDDDDANDNDSPRGGNGTEFGNVKLGESKTREFRIQNKGNETLTVTSLEAASSQFEFTDIQLPAVVAAGQDFPFGIRYTPGVFASRDLRVVMNNDEGPAGSSERRYTFRVGGKGVGPDLVARGGEDGNITIPDGSLTPVPDQADGRHFGEVDASVAGPVTTTFALANLGNDGLNLSNPRFTGPGASAFSHEGVSPGSNIAASTVRSFGIRFNPSEGGIHDATFEVTTNDKRAGLGTYTFAIRGIGVATSRIEVKGKSRITSAFNRIEIGDTSPAANDGTALGSTNSPDAREFRIFSTGTAPLVIDSIESSNPIVFPIQGEDGASINFPLTVMSNNANTLSFRFEILFTPAEAKSYFATITLRSDDPTADPFTFRVSGTGSGVFSPPSEMNLAGRADSGAPLLAVESDNGTWLESNATLIPDAVIGQTYTRTFRIMNSAPNPLIIDPASSDSTSPEFVVSGLPTEVNDIEAKFFTVSYTPTQVGYQESTIVIANNDPDLGGEFILNLRGFGVPEPVGVGPILTLLGGDGFGAEVPRGSDRPDTRNGTQFGGDGARETSFAIYNSGDEGLKVEPAEFEGNGESGFELIGLSETISIEPGSTYIFTIRRAHPENLSIDALLELHSTEDDTPFSFVVGTEPAGAPLKITTVRRSENDLFITVTGASGRRFRFQSSNALSTWSPLPGPYSDLAPGTYNIFGAIPQAQNGKRYFRVLEE